MKKMISVCMTAVLAASLLAGGAVQAFALSADTADPTAAAATEENCLSGSWKRASSPEITPKIQKLCDKAFADLEGAIYTPEALLAIRNTAGGMEYRILCRMTIVVPDAEEQYVVVTLRKNWLGRVELAEVSEDPLGNTDLAGVPGGWQQPDSPAMTDAASEAFNKAVEGLVGVDYTPVALLSTQVVAGTNYRILCEATVVYPGAETHYVVVTVYEDLEGNASILNVSDSFLNGAAE